MLHDATVLVDPCGHHRVDLDGKIAHLFDLGLGRSPIDGIAGDFADGLQPRGDGGGEFGVFQARVERGQAVEEIVHHVRLHQSGRALRAVILRGDDAPEFESAQPPAEADHVRHLLVAQFDHRFLHVGLGFDQLELESGPVAPHAEFEQAVGAGGE
ncbi:MAG: hypothetical protein ACK55I_44250, partial [bacterium]